MSSRKTCCVCGLETHPQPQDPNHDDGYGHCHSCLLDRNCYLLTIEPLPYIYDERPVRNGELTSDDSHAKIVEVVVLDKVVRHFTSHLPKAKIIEWAMSRNFG
jgi:hypothetical protein